LVAGQAIHFRLPQADDPIDFIVLDTVLAQKKPVFLFCQGSLPIPLFFQYGAETYLIGGGATNFDLAEIRRQYYFVVVSMPHTPLVAGERNLNDAYCFIPDSTQKQAFDPAFVRADHLDNYVRRGNAVLKFLRKQPWVDKRKLLVAGHSQGAKVATKIARQNKHVSHLGLFAANPFGRADQFLREARKQAEAGTVAWETADRRMQEVYAEFQAAHEEAAGAENPQLRALKTFSEPFLDDWLALDRPIYLAYGTADISADLCDLVPLFFIQEGKKNLTHRRYLNLEHNFFERRADGRTDYEKAHWPTVMHEFLAWAARR
jgi:pimeloyl-ACP methyl ester carboxylesterase